MMASSTRWVPPEPTSGRGRSHGTSSAEPFDRWFRYPAGFASDYVSLLIDRLSLQPGQVIVDCFAGSAVTGTAARARGLGFVGIEAHPMMVDLANAKLASGADPESIDAAATHTVSRARRSLRLSRETSLSRARTREPDLVQRSFDAPMLDELLALRRSALKCAPTEQRYLKWALLGSLRDVAAVKVGWPYQRPGIARRPLVSSALNRFQQRAQWIAADVRRAQQTHFAGHVIHGDATQGASWSTVGSADGCVSSPPYLNNFDYADATRLEAYFWGEATSWSQLCRHIRADMLTASTQQSSSGERDRALESMADSAIVDEITDLTAALAEARRGRSRGKEYDQVLPAYFESMRAVLTHLASALSDGAPCAWLIGDSAPYGVYVDTPRLIGELATAAGLEVIDDVALRRRGMRWRSTSVRHGVELSERILVLRRRVCLREKRIAARRSARAATSRPSVGARSDPPR
ncbi:hypothetical protein MSIMFB_03891 [Mycobacterium simulans]|uniref:Methyltransferase n=1 Tax=Mycobacterium simulans TaxID=627089 RepID=A0A7Z7NBX3_9MYCO|nr:DNA methyltransferase [Mycobacterium simulans]SOJ56414.1 hypothetical protein MSIMFB_03891 [Mycobacterium simulans]